MVEWRHLQNIFGSNSRANGSVCVISAKCNKTSVFTSVLDTVFRKFHDTDCETRPSNVRVEKMGPVVVSLSANFDRHSVATCRLILTKWIIALMKQVPLHYITVGLCGAHECNWNYGGIFSVLQS